MRRAAKFGRSSIRLFIPGDVFVPWENLGKSGQRGNRGNFQVTRTWPDLYTTRVDKESQQFRNWCPSLFPGLTSFSPAIFVTDKEYFSSAREYFTSFSTSRFLRRILCGFYKKASFPREKSLCKMMPPSVFASHFERHNLITKPQKDSVSWTKYRVAERFWD